MLISEARGDRIGRRGEQVAVGVRGRECGGGSGGAAVVGDVEHVVGHQNQGGDLADLCGNPHLIAIAKGEHVPASGVGHVHPVAERCDLGDVEVDLPQPGIPAGGSAPEDVSESVKLVERRAHRVTVQVKLARAGLVVFSDTWTPDWKATIDGRSETVVPANLFMRAVPCPAGEHTISVYYESESFGRGSIVSLGSLALCLALFLVGPLRRRISRPRSDPS